MHAIDPHVDVVAIGKAPLLEGPVLGLPLVGQPRDVRGGQTAGIVPLQRRERPTVADAICDRLLHPAHRVVLRGPSRRKEVSPDS